MLVEEVYRKLFHGQPPDLIANRIKEKRPERRIQGDFFLESAIWCSFIIPELALAFPGCRFIWLTRDIFSWSYSAYRRGWYKKGGVCTAMSVIRPEPANGWWPNDKECPRYFKLGWLYGTTWRHTYNGLVQAEQPWLNLDMCHLNDADIMNTIKEWCGFPGSLVAGAHENRGDYYATEAELRKWKLWDKIRNKKKLDRLDNGRAHYDIDMMSKTQRQEVRQHISFRGLQVADTEALLRGFVAGVNELLGRPVAPYWAEFAARHHKIYI